MSTDHEDRETVDDIDETKQNVDSEESDLDDTADADDSEDEDDSKEDEGEDDADDDKPVSRKELKSTLKGIHDTLAAIRRHGNKKPTLVPKDKNYQGGKPAPKDSNAESRIDRLEQVERKRTFGHENGLSPKEVDMVFKFDRNPSRKTLKDPFVIGGLEKLRSSARVDQNVPGGAAPTTFKVNGKDWNELPADQKQANFNKRQEAILAAKRRR